MPLVRVIFNRKLGDYYAIRSKKTVSFTVYIEMIILPRQARDKHRESCETRRFLHVVYAGNATLQHITQFFYQTLTQKYSYATGGSNVGEHWEFPGQQGSAIATAVVPNATAAGGGKPVVPLSQCQAGALPAGGAETFLRCRFVYYK